MLPLLLPDIDLPGICPGLRSGESLRRDAHTHTDTHHLDDAPEYPTNQLDS